MRSLDDLITFAKSNGYQPGAHSAEDGIRQNPRKANDTTYRQESKNLQYAPGLG